MHGGVTFECSSPASHASRSSCCPTSHKINASSQTTRHTSHAICHMSHVTYHTSHANCHAPHLNGLIQLRCQCERALRLQRDVRPAQALSPPMLWPVCQWCAPCTCSQPSPFALSVTWATQRQVHRAARASLATDLYKLQRMPPLSTINRHARIVIAMLTCNT
jgi:hypothetical protein